MSENHPTRAKVHLRIEFGDSGFDSKVNMLWEDAEKMTKLFSEAVQRAMPGAAAKKEGPGVPPGWHSEHADERDQEPC
ncbi:MAG: hypothetical protein KGJ23_08705 [Euryarchaeota archaeon]|nr:hypothetical protein [Euryarchaeota archaeon]MDE1836683.1 hypothetical protein [Euryarchaeota archaeon]MDE1880288.1 hypothetical protein [Euryarchaeota archaeon]MDE2044653.1 hypothetical protein [Thermoplasmata archaeon]